MAARALHISRLVKEFITQRKRLIRANHQRARLTFGDIDGLAQLITQEMGKTLRESEEEVADNSDKDEYCELVMAANHPEQHGDEHQKSVNRLLELHL